MWIGNLSHGKRRPGLGAAEAPVTGAAIWIGAAVLLETRWVVTLLLSTFGFSLLRLLGAWVGFPGIPDRMSMPGGSTAANKQLAPPLAARDPESPAEDRSSESRGQEDA